MSVGVGELVITSSYDKIRDLTSIKNPPTIESVRKSAIETARLMYELTPF